MFDEDNLLPISALQHLSYCERQWGLIHLEQAWVENVFTAEGRVLHDRAHSGGVESRGGVRIARGLRLRSLRLGLTGVADVVEFHRIEAGGRAEANTQSAEKRDTNDAHQDNDSCLMGLEAPPPPVETIAFPDVVGQWRPFPVEYKRGRPKRNRCDEVQLCAQAICLEEMLGVHIPSGSLFYGQTRRRTDVRFDDALRRETVELAARLHTLNARGITPPPVYEARKCQRCSLLNTCQPQSIRPGRNVMSYMERALAAENQTSESDNPHEDNL